MKYLSTFVSNVFEGIDYDLAIDKAVDDNKEQIEDLNIDQLNRGEDSDGGSTGIYKSLAYKGRLSPVDLNKTGAFHKGITANSNNGQLLITGTDSKTDLLQDIYGDSILGISEENISDLVAILLEDVAINITNQILR